MPNSNLVVAQNTPLTPLFDKNTGQMNHIWIKWFQGITQAVNSGLNIIGQFVGTISTSAQVQGRSEGIGATLQNIGPDGIISTNNLTDGTGNPLEGGRTAFQAMIASAPVNGQALFFNGTEFAPRVASFTDILGTASAAQVPELSGISGAVAPIQVPTLNALRGAVTASQLPSGGFSGTVTLAALTIGGTQGSITFSNGQATAVVNPT
jgi:hypothetical protein